MRTLLIALFVLLIACEKDEVYHDYMCMMTETYTIDPVMTCGYPVVDLTRTLLRDVTEQTIREYEQAQTAKWKVQGLYMTYYVERECKCEQIIYE